jgi:hypothetical protein
LQFNRYLFNHGLASQNNLALLCKRGKEICMLKRIAAIFFLAIASLLAAQQTLNNDGVIKMTKAGISEEVIASAVSSSPGSYDTSADALVALKSAGVGDKVIAAMVSRTAGTSNAPAPAPSSALPPGIDEVGVYFQNKTGNWSELMPEVVNFKTGGVMKRIATQGIVKEDTNGHIEGKTAKVQVTLPVVFAVYVPEGTAITEYQVVRLHQQSNSREFRSVTGGVFHESGGAKRDLIQFEPQKIAPRLYQISLDTSAGKGEYGIIPPGSYNSSNMASGGKIYTVSVIE